MMTRLSNISKSFSGNKVLDNVDMEILPGQIHALVGENGAGKSTLMKILLGVEQADKGEIIVDDQVKKWNSPIDARNAGISMVYQELSLVPTLSVVENVFLGTLEKNKAGLVDWNLMNDRVEQVFHDLDVHIDLKRLVSELSIAEKQIVEITRSLVQNSQLIILDEPTSPLTEHDAAKLFHRLKKLKTQGMSIVYITHRLEEVKEIADVVTILRDGQKVASCNVSDVNTAEIIHFMVGRELNEQFPPKNTNFDKSEKAVLTINNASRNNEFKDISFTLRRGEILGISGLVGSGRTELVECICGVKPFDSGSVEKYGHSIKVMSPVSSVKNGFGLVPDDRKDKGLITDASVLFNLNLAKGSTTRKFLGWRSTKDEFNCAKSFVEQLKIKVHSYEQSVSSLSGGNQQKIVIGKALATECSIIIFDEPTRGIDVGAKRDIYFLIRELASRGSAIIVVSSELEEILGLCDNILVMHEGRIVGLVDGENSTQEQIMALAVGE